MAENPFKTPVDDRIMESSPVRLARVWRRFLANIEDLGARQTESVAQMDTGSTPTNDELRDKINELLAGLEAAGLMKGE